MALSKLERDAIRAASLENTKAEFADEVAKRTTLTTAAVLALGKTQEERKALAEVLSEVTKATASNESKARAILGITGGVEALVKLAAHFL